MKVMCNNKKCNYMECYHKIPHSAIVLENYFMETDLSVYCECTDKEVGCKHTTGIDDSGHAIIETSWCELCEMDEEYNRRMEKIFEL